MRPLIGALLGACLATPALWGSEPEKTCDTFGTRVEFVGTPAEAARLAKDKQKLVFVLHVSGHFEDPRFT